MVYGEQVPEFSEDHPDHFFQRVDSYLRSRAFVEASDGRYKRQGDKGNGKTIQNALWDALKEEVSVTNGVYNFEIMARGARIRPTD